MIRMGHKFAGVICVRRVEDGRDECLSRENHRPGGAQVRFHEQAISP